MCMVDNGYILRILLSTTAALVVCIMAFKRARMFHEYLFEGVFLAALEYGSNINEVIENKRSIKS